MALSRTLSDLLEQDRIAKFIKTGNTTATLGSLTLNTATSGAGGLDTGTIAASTFYYVYTVVSSNAVKLVASTSATSPTGFTQYKKVGAFYTNSSSNIFKAYFYGEVNMTVLSAKISNTGTVSGENIDFIDICTINSTGNYTCSFNSSIFTVSPNCFANLDQALSSASQSASAHTSTVSSVQFRILAGGAPFSGPITVVCQKTGVDATIPDWSRI